jgi:hypothetical protein
MILDWETRIEEICNRLGIEPERCNENEELRDFIAKCFGFIDHDDFITLPTVADIVGEMAVELKPEHKNYQLHLSHDCIATIVKNYVLYSDAEQTEFQIRNFLAYAKTNFTPEIKYVIMVNLGLVENEKIKQLSSDIMADIGFFI